MLLFFSIPQLFQHVFEFLRYRQAYKRCILQDTDSFIGQ